MCGALRTSLVELADGVDDGVHLADHLADVEVGRVVGPRVGKAPHGLPAAGVGRPLLRSRNAARGVPVRQTGAHAAHAA
jgi:hypothetical protein